MSEPTSRDFDFLNRWFSLERQREFQSEWQSIQKSTGSESSEKMDALLSKLEKNRLTDELFLHHWNRYRDILAGKKVDHSRFVIDPPLINSLLVPAAEDASNVPFRSVEARIFYDIIHDHQVAIITGFPTIDYDICVNHL